MNSRQYSHILVVGLGLIGASFAAAVKEHCPEYTIAGCDTDPHAREIAQARGWVDTACDDAEPAFTEALSGSDLVVLATPASATLRYLDKIADARFQGIVTDTASTKSGVCEHAESVLEDPSTFIPGHPMAGSEKNGIDAARPGLFEGCHWILCPDEQTGADAFSALHDLLTSIRARVISLPREEHDNAVAIVSHVPHIVASSLVELACEHADEQETLFKLAAGGFRDSTRIAAGSADLWTGISFDNRKALADGLREMQSILGRFQTALDEGDRASFSDLLESASKARRSLPAKWVPATDSLMEVRIPMENRSGVVAEVTTLASKAGCNIMSIAIDHLTAHSAVLSMIFTDEGDVGRFSTELVKAGFKVSMAPLTHKE